MDHELYVVAAFFLPLLVVCAVIVVLHARRSDARTSGSGRTEGGRTAASTSAAGRDPAGPRRATAGPQKRNRGAGIEAAASAPKPAGSRMTNPAAGRGRETGARPRAASTAHGSGSRSAAGASPSWPAKAGRSGPDGEPERLPPSVPVRPSPVPDAAPDRPGPLLRAPSVPARPGTPASSIRTLAAEIVGGDRRSLSRGITLVESRHPRDRPAAAELVQAVYARAGSAIRIGVSGPPGVGKSTFSEALGLHAITRGHRVAVLAVDPSSTVSGGSILGDKTRMEKLGRSDRAFIRPSPSGGLHGGIAQGVRESVTLCEAAGFDVLLIETMGVGQAELAVREVVDLVTLLVQPGAGDDLQGIKRGIVEIADFILVNKADGDLKRPAALTVGDYKRALRLMSPPSESWQPEVIACSAVEGTGIGYAWERIEAFAAVTTRDGTRSRTRGRQSAEAVWAYVNLALRESVRQVRAKTETPVADLEANVRAGRVAPVAAAATLLNMLRADPRGRTSRTGNPA